MRIPMFLVPSLAFLAGLLLAPAAHPSGGSAGRGGGSLLRLDGEWDLLEIQRMRGHAGETYRLTTEARAALETIRRLFEDYSGLRSPRYWREVLGDLADIRLVRRLPCSPPAAAEIVHYGCTEDGITYLDETRFAGLEPKRQLLALLHERGHAYDPADGSHAWIHPFVQALSVLVDLKLEQQAGSRRRLTAAETRALLRLFESEAFRAAFARVAAPTPVPVIAPRGGGTIWAPPGLEDRIDLDRDSFVSVDSRVDYRNCARDSRAGIALAARGALRIRESSVSGSRVECVSLERAAIRDSSIRYRATATDPRDYGRLADARIEDSRLEFRTRSFEMTAQTSVRGSTLISDRAEQEIRFDSALIQESGIDYTGRAWTGIADRWRLPEFVIAGTVRRGKRREPGLAGQAAWVAESDPIAESRLARSIDEAPSE